MNKEIEEKRELLEKIELANDYLRQRSKEQKQILADLDAYFALPLWKRVFMDFKPGFADKIKQNK